MASVVSIIPIVLLFVLMLGFKIAGHKSALLTDRKSTRLNSSHCSRSRMPSSD